jgi:DNA polymerase/3'-5' exonuclease PolX
MNQKIKYTYAEAYAVAMDLVSALSPFCDRITIAGSLRRRKTVVGDVEILYIGKQQTASDPNLLFGFTTENKADYKILSLETSGIFRRRLNVNGLTTYGLKNKLMVHCDSGIPIDLFSATEENWWNYLVCRTGPAESNIRIATAAKDKGFKWNPYGAGFSGRLHPNKIYPMRSEREVFEFVGLEYKEPWQRA